MLIVRMRSIGDTVLITPCLSILKGLYPDMEIDVLLDQATAPVLKGHPLVSRVFEVPKGESTASTCLGRLNCIRQLRSRRYDIAVNLHGGPTSMILARLSCTRRTAGFANLPASWIMCMRSPHASEVWGRDGLHTVEHQLSLLKWLGVPMPEPLPRTSLAVDPDADAIVQQRLRDLGYTEGYAVVHPAAAWLEKQWSADGFAAVAERLYEEYHLPSVVIGAPPDVFSVDAVLSRTRTPAVGMLELPLAQTMALIARSSFLIGNDSGPAHIAAAFHVPLVVVFGLASFVPAWRPWTDSPNRAVKPEAKDERVCSEHECSECRFPDCVRQVGVPQVIEAVDDICSKATKRVRRTVARRSPLLSPSTVAPL